jgi:uncharacterized protein (TIGR02594 family)
MPQSSPLLDPQWLQVARLYVGLAEVPGAGNHPKISAWLQKLKAPFRDDETPWCGTFVGGSLDEAGYPGIANPWGARNWLKYGVEIDRPAYGCIVVFWRGSKSGWSGHVGFVVGVDALGNLMVLGGNQGNKVSIKPFPLERVLEHGYRWPGKWPYPGRFVLPVLDSNGRVSTNEQ